MEVAVDAHYKKLPCGVAVAYRASEYVLPSKMGKCLKKNSTLLLVCWTMEQYTLATPGCTTTQ